MRNFEVEKVTHCMCLIRENENSDYKVLTPYGICQKTLRYWGEDVQVAVTTDDLNILFYFPSFFWSRLIFS